MLRLVFQGIEMEGFRFGTETRVDYDFATTHWVRQALKKGLLMIEYGEYGRTGRRIIVRRRHSLDSIACVGDVIAFDGSAIHVIDSSFMRSPAHVQVISEPEKRCPEGVSILDVQ